MKKLIKQLEHLLSLCSHGKITPTRHLRMRMILQKMKDQNNSDATFVRQAGSSSYVCEWETDGGLIFKTACGEIVQDAYIGDSLRHEYIRFCSYCGKKINLVEV